MSLGMSFARRRMMAAAKKEPKYVWAVYDFAYVRDDETATTGSFSATRTRTKMAASAYTVNESGFTLTSPTSTSLQNLQVGQYLVDVSTSSNSSTSGTYLYEITGKSGSSTVTIQYKRYSVDVAKGDTEIDRVESETMDYPVDGEKDGLWYVMIKGLREVFVWDEYNLTYRNGYKVTSTTDGGSLTSGYYQYASTYTFDATTGLFTLNNPKKAALDNADEYNTTLKNMYFYKADSASARNTIRALAGTITLQGGMYYGTITTYQAIEDETVQVLDSKGEATGNTVESVDGTAYPQDGIQGDYWYTYSGSYTEEFDNR